MFGARLSSVAGGLFCQTMALPMPLLAVSLWFVSCRAANERRWPMTADAQVS